MLKCWNSDPNKRPPFSQLANSISEFAEKIAGYLDVRNYNPFEANIFTATTGGEDCDNQAEEEHDTNVCVSLDNRPVVITVECPSEDEGPPWWYILKTKCRHHYSYIACYVQHSFKFDPKCYFPAILESFVYSTVFQLYRTWSFACMCRVLLLFQVRKKKNIPSLLWGLELVQLHSVTFCIGWAFDVYIHTLAQGEKIPPCGIFSPWANGL